MENILCARVQVDAKGWPKNCSKCDFGKAKKGPNSMLLSDTAIVCPYCSCHIKVKSRGIYSGQPKKFPLFFNLDKNPPPPGGGGNGQNINP